MRESPESEGGRERIGEEAAAWVLRRDRGLDASERKAYSEWLAADPERESLVFRHAKNWDRLDQLARRSPCRGLPDPDLLKPSRGTIRWFLPLSFAAAAAIALGVYLHWPHQVAQSSLPAVVVAVEERTLEDGSTILLNGDTAVTVRFTPKERVVTFNRGEVHFTVAKNPARPFIVNAGGVRIRAVGTAFDVWLDSSKVAILVTEGRVRVDRLSATRIPARAIGNHESPVPVPQIPVLKAGQRALVSLSSDGQAPQVASVSADQMARLLSWQPRLLDFTDAQLGDVCAEFNRHNVAQLRIADPALAAFRISASFRSDNVDGFVRLLESSFGVQAERRGTSEIVLSKVRR